MLNPVEICKRTVSVCGRRGVSRALQRLVKYASSLGSATPPNLWYEIEVGVWVMKYIYSRVIEVVVIYLRTNRCIGRVGGVVMLPVNVHEAVQLV